MLDVAVGQHAGSAVGPLAATTHPQQHTLLLCKHDLLAVVYIIDRSHKDPKRAVFSIQYLGRGAQRLPKAALAVPAAEVAIALDEAWRLLLLAAGLDPDLIHVIPLLARHVQSMTLGVVGDAV